MLSSGPINSIQSTHSPSNKAISASQYYQVPANQPISTNQSYQVPSKRPASPRQSYQVPSNQPISQYQSYKMASNQPFTQYQSYQVPSDCKCLECEIEKYTLNLCEQLSLNPEYQSYPRPSDCQCRECEVKKYVLKASMQFSLQLKKEKDEHVGKTFNLKVLIHQLQSDLQSYKQHYESEILKAEDRAKSYIEAFQSGQQRIVSLQREILYEKQQNERSMNLLSQLFGERSINKLSIETASQAREKIEAELRERIEAELREKIEAELRERIEAELRERIEAELRERIESELRERIEIELTEKIEAELTEKIESEMKDHIMCSICMEQKKNTVFIPCGHMLYCNLCAHEAGVSVNKKLRRHKYGHECDICKVKVKKAVQAFAY